jgi:AIR synthase-related protein
MVRLGDDCAAIPDGDGYLLLAMEGLLPEFVATDPWFAGWCAVLVNVSDIYAMGGRPIALVDALWSQTLEQADLLWQGMMAAAQALAVPIVGGHSNCHSPYEGLAVAILGRAQALLTSFSAQPGDHLLLVIDLMGQLHPRYPFWDAATLASGEKLRSDLALLPYLAEQGLCQTAKDISMGGLLGTTLMLLETSGCGAILNIDAIPCPPQVPLATWLTCFPSYGFLLSLPAVRIQPVQDLFHRHQLTCEPVGEVTDGSHLSLYWQGESLIFWDLDQTPLTGFRG